MFVEWWCCGCVGSCGAVVWVVLVGVVVGSKRNCCRVWLTEYIYDSVVREYGACRLIV